MISWSPFNWIPTHLIVVQVVKITKEWLAHRVSCAAFVKQNLAGLELVMGVDEF